MISATFNKTEAINPAREMFAPNITMMPTASPAPLMVEIQTKSAPRAMKAPLVAKQNSRLNMDKITMVSERHSDDNEKPVAKEFKDLILCGMIMPRRRIQRQGYRKLNM